LLSSILRKAVVEETPLLIDNPYPLSYLEEEQLPSDLVEALRYENPDAEPNEIEDALQEVMDQLRDAPSSEFRAPSSEFDVPDSDFGAFDTEPGVFDPDLEPRTSNLETDELRAQDSELAIEILESARHEAQQVLAQADERAAEIERAAYDKGYEEGVEAGKAGGEEQAAELIKQVLAIVDQATDLHDTMLREAESEMVALCLEIARKIIQSELRTNPDVVKSVVSAAVKKINGSPRVTIKVNPSQVEAVRAHWDAAFGAGYREKEWIVEGDANVSLGGCVLDTKYGSIDARIGTQFTEMQKTFALLLGTSE